MSSKHLCQKLSDWEVLEAHQMWDGTYGGAIRLSGYYAVSYRTLLRAFTRLREREKRGKEQASE